MSNLLNDIKQTFSGQKPAHELDEISKLIMEIENKKRLVSQASANEHNMLLEKINIAFKQIGETAYTMYAEDSFQIDNIIGMFDTVKELYKTIEEKQSKLNVLLANYEEELKILRPNLPTGQGQGHCMNCGTAYIAGEMLFCSKCGSKLPEAPQGDVPQEKIYCANCGAGNDADSIFCAGCGSKL